MIKNLWKIQFRPFFKDWLKKKQKKIEILFPQRFDKYFTYKPKS